MSKTLKKLAEDARYESESWAHALGRTTTAKHVLDAAMREEAAVRIRAFAAIEALANYVAAPEPSKAEGGAE